MKKYVTNFIYEFSLQNVVSAEDEHAAIAIARKDLALTPIVLADYMGEMSCEVYEADDTEEAPLALSAGIAARKIKAAYHNGQKYCKELLTRLVQENGGEVRLCACDYTAGSTIGDEDAENLINNGYSMPNGVTDTDASILAIRENKGLLEFDIAPLHDLDTQEVITGVKGSIAYPEWTDLLAFVSEILSQRNEYHSKE